ncbi:Gfo/Idh/MocA family oxidoreductase [Saccharibacillus sp. CPCC 101409]|uniref:Gfo/Idh/MocA family protein n=1 Tax=Saccharibacillus sp. CPCC 101409 TaxID=3058041 RepID=UPI0026725772|nr:Gfo/Idh/MocA family oxidoreductase [Saccharibacillus sp. CPCC 101409]MDO3408901.1 Gfo/Idh/MocA family oxidoreductase [Saccharibacillus sp. CPCC 101409]
MKIGIAGSGGIVRVALEALRQAEGAEAAAICVREPKLALGRELAERFGIGSVYTDYDKMLADPALDFIYIGIVNSLHYDYARRALEAGKHVIAEKPFTSTAEEARELLALAERRRLYLLEAVTTLYSPDYLRARELLGSIGPVRLVQANFSKRSSRYGDYLDGRVLPAFDPAFSGGALYDLNIYNLHLVAGLFGAPREIRYLANIGPNGIDTSGAAALAYPGFVALCCAAKDSDGDNFALIQGENGSIRLDGPPNLCSSLTVTVGGVVEHIEFGAPDNHMVNEFRAFEEIYRTGQWEKSMDTLRHSALVMELAARARRDAGIVFPADTAGNAARTR